MPVGRGVTEWYQSEAQPELWDSRGREPLRGEGCEGSHLGRVWCSWVWSASALPKSHIVWAGGVVVLYMEALGFTWYDAFLSREGVAQSGQYHASGPVRDKPQLTHLLN